jgi:hypothetical protein
MGEIPQIQVYKACDVIPKKTLGCNGCRRWINKVFYLTRHVSTQ